VVGPQKGKKSENNAETDFKRATYAFFFKMYGEFLNTSLLSCSSAALSASLQPGLTREKMPNRHFLH
jgi:hypothetical protein